MPFGTILERMLAQLDRRARAVVSRPCVDGDLAVNFIKNPVQRLHPRLVCESEKFSGDSHRSEAMHSRIEQESNEGS